MEGTEAAHAEALEADHAGDALGRLEHEAGRRPGEEDGAVAVDVGAGFQRQEEPGLLHRVVARRLDRGCCQCRVGALLERERFFERGP